MKKLFNFSLTVLRFFKKYLFKNPLFILTYGLQYFNPNFTQKVKFYPKSSSTKLLSQKSLIRLGDGEIHLMLGQGIGFQEHDQLLADGLIKCIKNYSENSPYILAINQDIPGTPNKNLREKGSLKLWLPMKVFYFLYFNKYAPYLDASLFYYQNSFKEIVDPILENKKLVLIAREETIENFIKNSPHKDIEYIQTEDNHAFRDYKKVKNQIAEYVKNNKKNETIFLLACGPLSKVLVFDFATELHLLDIGVGLEMAYTDIDKSTMIEDFRKSI